MILSHSPAKAYFGTTKPILIKAALNYVGVGFLVLLSALPYRLVVLFGYGLGAIAARIPGKRNRVVITNLRLCFPQLSNSEIDVIANEHWKLLGRSIAERGIIWLGSAHSIANMVEVRSAVDLCDQKPRILVNMHFTGIEGSIVISALAAERGWPRTSGLFQRMKNSFFNERIIRWRNRFGGNAIDRQGNLLPLIREIRKGNLIIIAPDLDLGLRDSVFVPFFGVQTNTITAVSRLASIAQAEVCMMVTTLLPDRSRYCCLISKPIDGFPSDDPIADTARLNTIYEAEVRQHIAEYYWVHKRFKNRPDGQASPY
jgi:Kdo2-lipid IVA lauroyltransferase/acyltransferase